MIPFSPPRIDDKICNEVVAALKSGWITTGPRTKTFEKKITEYCGHAATLCLNSATAGLEIMLRWFGVQEGDEVILPAYTYSATANVVIHCGATPVFVDVNAHDFNISVAAIEAAITERTKVIMPVDFAGWPCDYDEINALVQKHKQKIMARTNEQKGLGRILVLSDSAHSFGTSYKGKKTGALTDVSVFSFHAVKNLTTAEGGAITWRDNDALDNVDVYKDLQLLSLHGQNKDALSKMSLGSWEYDIIYPGYKCNMTDMTAALGLAQLERFPKLMEKRMKTIAAYDHAFLPLGVERLQHHGEDYQGNGHLYLARLPGVDEQTRNMVIAKMALLGISCNVHFKPLPMFTAYHKMGFNIQDYPNAYAQYRNEVTLPSHTLLTEDEVDYIIESFTSVLKKMKIAI